MESGDAGYVDAPMDVEDEVTFKSRTLAPPIYTGDKGNPLDIPR